MICVHTQSYGTSKVEFFPTSGLSSKLIKSLLETRGSTATIEVFFIDPNASEEHMVEKIYPREEES